MSVEGIIDVAAFVAALLFVGVGVGCALSWGWGLAAAGIVILGAIHLSRRGVKE